MHDRDSHFGTEFKQSLLTNGAQPMRLQIRAPNLNAYVERFIQTLQHECLNHFLVLGTAHMDHLVREFVEHYHAERPHQSLDNAPPRPVEPPSLAEIGAGPIHCQQRLGGLLKHYHRRAA